MSTASVPDVNPFRPQRYPALRAIVHAGEDNGQSLTDMVSETILKDIICEKLPAGTRLKSTQLAQRLGVSRTPVARALAKLSADGILEQPNNHQAIVPEGAAEWLVQIHELRQLLEPEAAFRATGQVPADVVDDLWTLASDARPTDKYDWSEAAKYFDFALHLAIADYCGNLPMSVSIHKCWSYKRLSYELSEGCRTELEPEYEAHVQILQALGSGNGEKCRHLMLAHLQTASQSRFSQQVV